MDEATARTGDAATTGKVSRFELAPPRRFVLPAVLLLLSERPGYGYELVSRLAEFHFGHVDRPAVYRALAQLEADGLARSSSETDTVGQARRVYRVTSLGERALRVWMGVIKDEHDYLGQVLRRYQATGTADAVLAEVQGGWASALSPGWSPVSSTLAGHRRLVPVVAGPIGPGPVDADALTRRPAPNAALERASPIATHEFRLVPDRSVVLIEVRSTVGPLSFGAVGITGTVHAALVDGALTTELKPTGHLEIDVTGLTSGNSLYDAELRRRIDAHNFPVATLDMRDCAPSGPGCRYRVEGELTFHGMTRPAQGTVSVDIGPDGRLIVTGEQTFDIRDFAIPSPTVLMLRIYPDVRVRLHAEAA